MEKINDISQINTLKDNLIWLEQENVSLNNSEVVFKGTNNLLYIERNVKISNSRISFIGDNAIVYLSSSQNVYYLTCVASNDSVVFLGKETYINSAFNNKLIMFATERQNIIIGNDCLFSYGICMRTADPHIVYDCDTKRRLNLSKSILIGDHVWVGQDALILKGSVIGSGVIVGAGSVVANKKITSNTSVGGNPIKTIRENVFFTKACVHNYTEEDTLKSMEFMGEKQYTYGQSSANVDICTIDNQLKETKDFADKLNLIKRMLVGNDAKDRFYVE